MGTPRRVPRKMVDPTLPEPDRTLYDESKSPHLRLRAAEELGFTVIYVSEYEAFVSAPRRGRFLTLRSKWEKLHPDIARP